MSKLWTIINRDRHEFLVGGGGGCGGMLPQNILKIGSLKTPFSALSGRKMWQNGTDFLLLLPKKSGYQVIAPILPKYDGEIIETEKDENRNMSSWCTLHTFIHLCYTTVVFNTRLKEGDFLPTSFEVILPFTQSMLCLKINWPQSQESNITEICF